MPIHRLVCVSVLIASCSVQAAEAQSTAPTAPAAQPALHRPTTQPTPLTPTTLPGLSYDLPFFPGAQYDAGIPTPDSVLGYPVGSRAARSSEIEAVLRAVAGKSPRTRLFEYARSHEGRKLHYIAISSERNIQRLDQIKTDAARLADPRGLAQADAERLVDSMPAIAWMGYCIHGDEMSGSDAALALVHHLAACRDEPVRKLLDELVVLIDPLMNPDGRDRCITSIDEARTSQPNIDDQSIMHSGVWPTGRMNHYLFDMNRDWILGTQPESRGRIAAAGAWNPHYFMESHEMGSQDTFLFQPPREPLNPNIPANVRKWTERFAVDHAAAFDRMGWRYYHGEWNEEWYPGYSGAWGALRNAVENLYEQANIMTDAVRRAEGTLQTYRESVHHQLVSSWTNLASVAANRKALLSDYAAERRRNVAGDAPWSRRVFALPPGENLGRQNAFIDLMLLQGFELYTATREFSAAGRDRLGMQVEERKFPAGTLLLPNRQPNAPLLAAMLEFDPRFTPEFLTEERRELLRFGRSRLYDVTAWNISMLYDLEAVELSLVELPAAQRVERLPALSGGVEGAEGAIAFVLDGDDDRSVAAAGRLMERGVRVRVAEKPFEFDGRKFARGALAIVPKDNLTHAANMLDALRAVASELQVRFVGVRSGLGAGDLPDLGGGHFNLLETPRIALIGRERFNPYSFGEAWYWIDHVLGLRASYLDATVLGDLRRYNVIVLPDGGAGLIRNHLAQLKDWVQRGGTLIAIGSSAEALAVEKDGLGSVRSIPEALGKSDEHRLAIVREWEGRRAEADVQATWAQVAPAKLRYPWMISGEAPGEDERKRRDAWQALFMPQGAIVAARVDDRSWLTAGCGSYLPVLYSSDATLLAWDGADAPLRFGHYVPVAPAPASAPAAAQAASAAATKNSADADADDKDADDAPGWAVAPPGFELRLRMSGLLWPEAAGRIAHSAYVTRERIGSGQVILFASSPTFRAGALGTARIFANALVYGPGLGASQPIEP